MRNRSVYGAALGLLLLLAPLPEAAAQTPYLSVRPAAIHENEWTVGVRWAAGLEPGQSFEPRLKFPRAWRYAVRGRGTAAARKASNPEPILDAEADVGLTLQLIEQLPCLPGNCPDDLTRFDLGYISLNLRAAALVDQGAQEGLAGLGAAVVYRPLGRQEGAWFLVPTVGVGYTADWVLVSDLRDALDVDPETSGRLDLEFIWHVFFAREGIPAWLQPGRFDATLAHFRRHGLADRVEDVLGSTGTFVALSLGYELTGKAPWVRQLFVRWSDGDHPVQYVDDAAWMLGIVIGREP